MSKRNVNWPVCRWLALSVLLSSVTALLPVLAADDSSSLDSMWVDQKTGAAAGAQSKAATAVPPKAAATTSSEAAANTEPSSADSSTATDTAAPMCSVDAFKNSAMVSKGGWPGVGPFKAEDGSSSQFVDEHSNHLKLDLNGGQVTRAQIELSGERAAASPAQELLDVQMNIDFLLEAVGLKPRRIQDFNSKLQKSKEALVRADQTPLNVTTGRFLVSIARDGAAGSGRYKVAVNSLDANKNVIKQHFLSDAAAGKSKTENIPPVTTFILHDHPDASSAASGQHQTAGGATAAGDKLPIKDQFAAVINEWQRVKKGAVRHKQTDELTSVLSGKALTRQSDAIKWLQTNHKYYDMNPKGVVVDQFTELSTGKKYMVSAQVREAYKFIDDATGKVLKEVDDVNKVNYTIEKIGGKWLITDSALLSTSTKTSSTSKGSH